jgi:hypothetical protein
MLRTIAIPSNDKEGREMKKILLLSAGLILMVTAPVFADCDLSWWTSHCTSVGENMLFCKELAEHAAVDHNGNIHFITATLGNPIPVDDKEEICFWKIEWEVCCERREVRALRARARHNPDWPFKNDFTVEMDKIWKSYDDRAPIGKACNEFCGRKSQLRTLASWENLKLE